MDGTQSRRRKTPPGIVNSNINAGGGSGLGPNSSRPSSRRSTPISLQQQAESALGGGAEEFVHGPPEHKQLVSGVSRVIAGNVSSCGKFVSKQSSWRRHRGRAHGGSNGSNSSGGGSGRSTSSGEGSGRRTSGEGTDLRNGGNGGANHISGYATL